MFQILFNISIKYKQQISALKHCSWNPHWKECKSFSQRHKLDLGVEMRPKFAILFFSLKSLPNKCQLVMKTGRDLWKVSIICNILTVILKIFDVKISIATQTDCLWVLTKAEQWAKQVSFLQWKKHLKLCVIYTSETIFHECIMGCKIKDSCINDIPH